MNNFDLRKYLAEGRLKVNEGDMDHLMQDLERELKQHDWFYYMADDPRSYDKGTDEQRELKRLLKMLNNSPEAIALYNKYAPVQGGIDLRIKEEKRPDYPDVDKDGDTEESMEKALKDKEVKEEYNIGKGMEKDHDFDAMLAHALKLHAGTSIEDLKKVSNDFEAVNYHRENAYLEDAIDMLAAGKHEEFEDSLKLFKDEVEKTIRSFKESIKESLRAYNVIDAEGNIVHEELPYDKALEKAKEVEGHKIDATDRLAEEDHDPDQEQLDDEDEIFMPMDDEGKPLEEALNPEVVKAVDRLIKALAKKYDYPERDAVFAIQAALKQRGFDNVNEDMDLGHQDNEPGMLKGDLYKIGKYSMELYQMMDNLEDIDGEVDLPHWWQSKVTTAKNMISGAKHYLDFELKEPAIDAIVSEAAPEEEDEFHRELDKLVHKTFGHSSDEKKEMKEDMSLEDEAKIYFMQKVKKGEIDELPEDPKAAFVAQMTKDQIDHDKETSHREGELEEIGMFNDPVGYEKSQPNPRDKVFTKKYVSSGIYDIFKNGKKVKTINGEGEANAWMNAEMRKLKEDEFYTRDVKDAVVSKLMDQLRK